MISQSNASRLQRSLSALQTAILSMDDATFQRAVAAWQRCERRRNRIEHPQGFYDARRRWFPAPEECTDVVRRARPPTASFPDAYRMVCRSLSHCEALEGADHGCTLIVKYWLSLMAQTHPSRIIDPLACRSALRLTATLDALTLGARPRHRPRL